MSRADLVARSTQGQGQGGGEHTESSGHPLFLGVAWAGGSIWRLSSLAAWYAWIRLPWLRIERRGAHRVRGGEA